MSRISLAESIFLQVLEVPKSFGFNIVALSFTKKCEDELDRGCFGYNMGLFLGLSPVVRWRAISNKSG